MVLWCKMCGALIGLREPVFYWYIDRWAICQYCARDALGAESSKPELTKTPRIECLATAQNERQPQPSE